MTFKNTSDKYRIYGINKNLECDKVLVREVQERSQCSDVSIMVLKTRID